VRSVLGLILIFAFAKFKAQVGRVFGPNVAKWLAIVQMAQFHLTFYFSRSLPNTFALALGTSLQLFRRTIINYSTRSHDCVLVLAPRKILTDDWLVYVHNRSFQKRSPPTLRPDHFDVISNKKNPYY
jgi:hypothetical protein